MKTKRYKEGQAPIPAGIAMGTAASILVSLVGAAIVAWLIHRETMPLDSVKWMGPVTAFLASAVGAWLSISWIKRKKLQMGLLTGACYLTVLFSATALLFGGQYDSVWMVALAVAAGAIVVSVLAAGGVKGPKKRIIKKAYR